MSLEELLKDSNESPKWSWQRKKLFRLVVGLSIFCIGIVAVVLIISSTRMHKKEMDIEAANNARSLAHLIKVKEEAKALQQDIRQMRRPASRKDSVQPRIISYEPGDGFITVSTAKNDIYIPQGAVFQAQLITPIKTSVQKTFVMAETTNEFRMDMKRRIPKRSRLIGRSYLNTLLKGVVLEFDTLVSPNGIESSISGLGLSRNALPEIDGLYFSNKLETYGTALAFGFLSGFADAARIREVTPYGSVPQVNLSNQVLGGLSTASFQVAEDILRDIQNRSIEYVVVPAGEQIFVALTRRYELNQGGPK